MTVLTPGSFVSAEPLVVIAPGAEVLAAGAAGRLVSVLGDAQASRGAASVVLTGGGVGIAVLAALATSPAREMVNWRRVDVWWSDERWLPPGDRDRNETQARAAALDGLDLDPARVHAMGADDGTRSVEDAAGAYDELVGSRADGGADFDVVLLGVGPDAHVASLFPEHPGTRVQDRRVISVHGSPKPPPTRISLTLPSINAARQVWLLASGTSKAAAVALAQSGAGPLQAPAGAVRGVQRTLWLLDTASAAQLN